MENFTENSVINLIEKISSSAPVPGGGAVSALSGSIAVALCEMVVGLTIGKKAYNEFDEEKKNKIINISHEAREQKGIFIKLFEKDNLAFEKVMEAMKLPKISDEEKEYRNSKIEEYTVGAMEVPLEVAKRMLKFYDNIEYMVLNGNKNCITDGAVASWQALAAINGAILNVLINLGGIGDTELVNSVKTEATQIIDEATRRNESIMKYVKSVL